MYARNASLSPGYIAYGNSLLIHRPVDYDKEENSSRFVQVVDADTLEVQSLIL